MDVTKEFKKFFSNSDALVKLIIINVAVFVIYHIIQLCYVLFDATSHFPLDAWLAAPTDLQALLTRPWTLITYMFTHKDILHLLFNMLLLYWFGRIFRLYFSNSQLVNVFILGGLSGVALYIASYNIFPIFATAKYISTIIGASAGVLAVVLAISCYVPRYSINLLFFGPVRLIYIAGFAILLDIISISMNKGNMGGHIAHLGGAFLGYMFALNIRKGKDITSWLTRFFKWCKDLFKPKPKMKVNYKKPSTDDWEYNKQKKDNQAEIDRILDKISKGGYDTLTREEKETLFNQKNK
ncbi:MAG: rhomboid family intramembrane serine protease [Bacteroidales bacterium]|jgi:membrane associated rhomboid family serine protease|nr:rhomboid family intramembrane serine protease [Bacteroidales bacterium]